MLRETLVSDHMRNNAIYSEAANSHLLLVSLAYYEIDTLPCFVIFTRKLGVDCFERRLTETATAYFQLGQSHYTLHIQPVIIPMFPRFVNLMNDMAAVCVSLSFSSQKLHERFLPQLVSDVAKLRCCVCASSISQNIAAICNQVFNKFFISWE